MLRPRLEIVVDNFGAVGVVGEFAIGQRLPHHGVYMCDEGVFLEALS